MKHLLSIEQLSREEIERILQRTAELKANRGKISAQPLAGQTWALIFSKPSTRTRVSFDVGIRELGGETIYLNAADAQLGRGELIKDTARVLARMIHGAVIRTYAQSDIEEFAEFSGVPTINALTDEEHPCQILGDIFTIVEKRGKIDQAVVAYVGDGVSNTAQSWLFAAGKLDFELRIASHKKYQPKKRLLERAGGRVTCTDDVAAAARDADVLYTDIWVSMGKGAAEARREAELGPYWLNDSAVRLAKPALLLFPFFAALPFAGRFPLFRWRAIDTGIESRWRSGFVDFSGVGSNSAKSFFSSSLNQENNGAAKLLVR